MEKFIKTVQELYPEEHLAFYKAARLLYNYALSSKNETALLSITEDIVVFKITIKGFNGNSPVLWVRYLHEICERTGKRLVEEKLFENMEEFYRTFQEPASKKDLDIVSVEKIFDAMADVVEEKYKEVYSETVA